MKGKPIPDSKINFSDIPELTNKQLSSLKRVGRPKQDKVKKMIALRVDEILLKKLKTLAKKKKIPYQTLLHILLEDAVKKAA